jgi:hypothetical protein
MAALLVLSAVIGCAVVPRATYAADAVKGGEFDGASFTCLNYTNGLGENATNKSQSILAHLWMQGYIAGFYKAKGTLELSDDKADQQILESLMLQRCRDYPGATILTVVQQAIAVAPHKVPARTIVDFNLNTYTCGQQLDAHSGSAGDASKADLADMWSFAFIQGYKNATAPDMVIGLENKPALVGAIAKYCAANRDVPLQNAAALVAEKVKMQ